MPYNQDINQVANRANVNALTNIESFGTAYVKVTQIETYVDQYGYTKPILHIAPKLRIGNQEIGVIKLQSWDVITETNIHPECTIKCEYGNKWCKIFPPTFSTDAVKKANAVIADIYCPLCGYGKIVSTSGTKRCTNPYCYRYIINFIWKFLRLGLRMGNLPYMTIYNLYRSGRLRRFENLWKLTDTDLRAIGLKGQDIDNFRLRLANAKEIRLDMLIYFLGLDDIKTGDALDIARKVNVSSNTEYIKYLDVNKLFDPIDLTKTVEVDGIHGTTKYKSVKDIPACTWRHYVIHCKRELLGIVNTLKIMRSKTRYTCAGFNFAIGDTGEISKNDIVDLIMLNDGNVIPLSHSTRWSMVSYFVTSNPSGDDYLLRRAKRANVNIISLQELETLFNIKAPDTELAFSELYERPESESHVV